MEGGCDGGGVMPGFVMQRPLTSSQTCPLGHALSEVQPADAFRAQKPDTQLAPDPQSLFSTHARWPTALVFVPPLQATNKTQSPKAKERRGPGRGDRAM
jgi:hypothetical protein